MIGSRFGGSVAAAVVLAVTLYSAATARAEDAKVDGTWEWTMPGRNGGQETKIQLKLKAEGEKVTGTVSGRAGAADTAIEDGKVDKDGNLSFTVTRTVQDTKMVSKYTGKVDGDAIKGKVETKRGDQDARSRDWEAKKAKPAA